jgi:hypothetical protein
MKPDSTTGLRRPSLIAGTLLLLASFPLACGDPAGIATPAQLEKVGGDLQEGVVGQPMELPVRVQVRGGDGSVLEGVTIAWTGVQGGDERVARESRTDRNGIAETLWTLGTQAGEDSLEAVVADLSPVTFTATALPASAATLTKVSGDGQEGVAGSSTWSALVVKVADRYGNGVPGKDVTWTVVEGGGSVTDSAAISDGSGLAEASWDRGPTMGSNTVRVESPGLAPVTFTITGRSGSPERFEKVLGDGQEGVPGEALWDSLVVKLEDRFGNPIVGAEVEWTLTEGGGRVEPASSTTDADGLARTKWTLGDNLGPNAVQAGASGVSPAAFSATGVEARITGLEILSGGDQIGRPDQRLGEALVVQALDEEGRPVAGEALSSRLVPGEGRVEPGEATTDSEGIARFTWTLGAEYGTQELRIRALGAEVRVRAILEGSLDHWLVDHPRVRDAICWFGLEEDTYACWDEWTVERRHELDLAEDSARLGIPVVQEPVENLSPSPADWVTQVSAADAWNLYRSYVGHSLYLERSGAVPWSLADYSDHELRVLLHVRHFEGLVRYTSFSTPPSYGYQTRYLTPSSPQVALAFFRERDLLGGTTTETVRSLIGWAYRMAHQRAGLSPLETAIRNYGYAGAPLMSSILEGRLERLPEAYERSYGSSTVRVHWTHGCHTTGKLFNWLLRSVNIPGESRMAEGHNDFHFTTEGRTLTHSDDMYDNQIWLSLFLENDADPLDLPAEESQWEAWRDGEMKVTGRNPLVLAMERLPNQWLRYRCQDYADGVEGGNESAVFRYNNGNATGGDPIVTVEELKAARVWERLDQAIEALGGCGSVPVPPLEFQVRFVIIYP